MTTKSRHHQLTNLLDASSGVPTPELACQILDLLDPPHSMIRFAEPTRLTEQERADIARRFFAAPDRIEVLPPDPDQTYRARRAEHLDRFCWCVIGIALGAAAVIWATGIGTTPY